MRRTLRLQIMMQMVLLIYACQCEAAERAQLPSELAVREHRDTVYSEIMCYCINFVAVSTLVLQDRGDLALPYK